MKSKDEIQRAHDLLIAILLDDEIKVVFQEDERWLRVAADVLCWILEHSHNVSFSENLQSLEATCLQAGFELRDLNESSLHQEHNRD